MKVLTTLARPDSGRGHVAGVDVLAEPVIWLLLYGALFKRVVEIPGFEGGSYIQFLTPGIVVMTASFSAGWAGMSLIVGASFPNGVGGALVLVVLGAAIGAGFGAMSNGLALLARREETLIATMNFLLLPLTFLSSAFMQESLIPGWIQTVGDFNPVNRAVEAGRAAALDDGGWDVVFTRLGLLAAFLLVCSVFATRAFRCYQRSV